jgi:hypothetical protein
MTVLGRVPATIAAQIDSEYAIYHESDTFNLEPCMKFLTLEEQFLLWQGEDIVVTGKRINDVLNGKRIQ